LLRWLAMDGYGFHEGYFHPRRTIDAGTRPRRVSGYGQRAFDQGLGRSLWFVYGADVERIAHTIAGLTPERHGDLWSGVGLAAAYAGGVSAAELEALRRLAGACLPAVAQGAAFAAKARQRAGNPAQYAELGCNILCGESLQEAAHATDAALEGLGDDKEDEPAYERWRQRVQHHFQRQQSDISS
jgi:enediyne biosynthesis protein E3